MDYWAGDGTWEAHLPSPELAALLTMTAMAALYVAWTAIAEPALGIHPLLAAVVRTAFLGALLAAAILGWKVSPTVNATVKKLKK